MKALLFAAIAVELLGVYRIMCRIEDEHRSSSWRSVTVMTLAKSGG